MVKKVDEDRLPDHIGWQLWQANRNWLSAFVGGMRDAGHDWFSEARAGLMGNIPRSGVRQSVLIDRLGTTKQAVQQLLDGLESEGIVERIVDSVDARGKYVRYTEKGLRALRDGDRVKQEIEARYVEILGEDRFAALTDALQALEAQR